MAIAARPTRAATYTATTVVDVASLGSAAGAGLGAFGNRDNVLAVTVERPDGNTSGGASTVVVWQTQKGERRTLATVPAGPTEQLYLRLAAKDRTRFEFAISPDGRNWKVVGGGDGEYLPPWDLAVRVALLVTGQAGSSARFGTFRLEAHP
jgi:hypothetical protein